MKEGLGKVMRDKNLQKECDYYLDQALFRYFINVFAAVVVGVINYLIKLTFLYLSSFERYKSITKENNSLMKKQFASIFINIGILLVLINANFQDSGFFRSIAEGLPGGSEFFFVGDFSDLDRSWYSKVAVSIIVLIITNLISNVISSFVFEAIRFVKRKFFAKRQVLQHDMNACMNGAPFNLSYKYALTLAIIYV